MTKRKKMIIGGAVLGCLTAAIVLTFLFLSPDKGAGDNKVYVNSVAEITGVNISSNRYAGVIEAQEEMKISLDGEKEVEKVFVEAGDKVEKGTKLFRYNMAEAKENLSQAKLELEGFGNEIADKNSEINQLMREKRAAGRDEQLSYSIEIQTLNAEIKQMEYERESKQLEISQLEESVKHGTVKSTMAGTVKSVSKQGTEGMESDTFMTILASGDYKIKGSVNEQNVSELGEGTPLIIRSRVDESQTWNGVVEKVDTDNTESSAEDFYDQGSSSDTVKSTSYPFYVTLESIEGLMLGQHVYMELDNGRGEEQEGLWLDEYYIVSEGEEAYVWASDKNEKIEKRKIVLGEHDEESGRYQVLEGLDLEDLIAYPEEHIKEGLKAAVQEAQEEENGAMGDPEMTDDSEMTDQPADETMEEPGIDEGLQEVD